MDLTLPEEFHAAVERKDWDVAALWALVTAAEALERYGPEALEAMLDEMAGEKPHRGSRGRRRKRG
jgi:hypothetical protein